MIKQEELPTSSKTFDCREDLSPLFCAKCGFSSHVLPSLIRHKEAGCGNKTDNLNFLLDAYKCRKCEFVTCSCFIASRHETKCSMLDAASCANSTSLWVCSHCEYSISYKHLKFGSITFECEDQDCYASTKREELKKHATCVHLPEECLKFFSANDGIKSKRIEQFCSEQFGSRVELSESRSDKYVCDECHFNCARKEELPMHKAIKPVETWAEKWFFCHDCGYKSKYKYNLHKHVINKHRSSSVVDIQWFECQDCPYKSKIKGLLRKHKMLKHTPLEDIKWFECTDCSFKAKTNDYLRRHINNKHRNVDVRRFECQDCPYKSKTKAVLQRHKLCQHLKHLNVDIQWCQCQDCPYKSRTKAALQRHKIFKHTPLEDIKWFECADCSFKAKTKEKLHQHIKSKHLNVDIQFECQDCSYKTKTKGTLRRHKIFKHTPLEDIKWFECAGCSFKAKTKDCLRQHTKSKHQNFLV